METTNIPDQLTYHAPHPPVPQAGKDRLYLPARIISAIFTPFLFPFVAFLLLFSLTYLHILPLRYKITMLVLVYCFTIFLPILSIYLFHKLSGRTLRALRHREKRFIPYVLTILSYAGCLFTMARLHVPRYLSGIITATLLCMVICAIVNVKWKISTHMASSGMMIGGMLSYSFIFQFNPVGWLSAFILLAGMLGSARIIVRQHTLGEVGGGFLVGFLCGVIGILFI